MFVLQLTKETGSTSTQKPLRFRKQHQLALTYSSWCGGNEEEKGEEEQNPHEEDHKVGEG